MIVVDSQEGKAKAEVRTCDEHVVPACTKFRVWGISSPAQSYSAVTFRVSANVLGYRDVLRATHTDFCNSTRHPNIVRPEKGDPAQPPRTHPLRLKFHAREAGEWASVASPSLFPMVRASVRLKAGLEMQSPTLYLTPLALRGYIIVEGGMRQRATGSFGPSRDTAWHLEYTPNRDPDVFRRLEWWQLRSIDSRCFLFCGPYSLAQYVPGYTVKNIPT